MVIGPTLMHKHRDEEAFAYLASSMIRVNPKLVSLLAIGSDRDRAIKKGLSSYFPNAVFVAYKKHFEDDLKHKLSELGMDEKPRKEFLVDIFGSEATQQRGLLDTTSMFLRPHCSTHNWMFGRVSYLVSHKEWRSELDGNCISHCTKEFWNETSPEQVTTIKEKKR